MFHSLTDWLNLLFVLKLDYYILYTYRARSLILLLLDFINDHEFRATEKRTVCFPLSDFHTIEFIQIIFSASSSVN